MSLENTVDNYYYSPSGLTLVEYEAPYSRHIDVYDTPPLWHDEELDPADVDEAMDEISRNIRVIEHGDSTFEIGTVNNDVDSDEVMLHISTYSSALSTNPGNLYELAAQAVCYPQFKHLYVASFGNGATSPILPMDRDYIKTGRFTQDFDGQTYPIKSIRNLYAALAKNGLNITRIMGTDSAGGHYARALALAMESGQLSHAFFSETSGFVDLSKFRIAKGMIYDEMQVNAKANKAISPDPEKMDDDKIARAKAAYDRHADTDERKKLEAHKVSAAAKLLSMKLSMQALRQGPNGSTNPLVADSDALLHRHTNARLSYGVAENDPLYLSPENSHQAAIDFLSQLTIQNAPVSVIMISSMSHAYNTHFPSLYHSIKKYALEI